MAGFILSVPQLILVGDESFKKEKQMKLVREWLKVSKRKDMEKAK